MSSAAADMAQGGLPAVWRGRLLVVAAAVLWSTSGLFAKAPWFDGWPAESRGLMLAFWRSLFATAVLIPLVRRVSWHPAQLSMSLCFGVMVWSFMSAMVQGPAAGAIWLQYLSPAWVLLIGVLFLGERLTATDVRMFVCCLAGVLLILAMELQGGGSLRASGLGILAGVAFAGVVLHLRWLRQYDSAWLMTQCQFASVLLLLPWVAGQPAGQIAAGSYGVLALFGIVQMSLPYIFFARGLRHVSSPEASVLTLLEPLLLPLWVYLAWHHHPSYQSPRWWIWAGGGLILGGLLMKYLPPLRERLRRARGARLEPS